MQNIKKTSKKLALALSISLGSLSLTTTPALSAEPQSPKPLSKETIEMLNLLSQVRANVHKNYVEETSDKKLIEGAIHGMLQKLDPHSAYISEKDLADFRTKTTGEFGGIGIEIEPTKAGDIKIITPIDDTPAYKAGIKAGDIITHIDGTPVQGISFSKAISMMRGKKGTEVILTIYRKGEKLLKINIIRDTIKTKSVRHYISDDMGYIRISAFQKTSATDMKKAVQSIEEKLGDKFAGLVLDLRNNPGGLLTQAIAVSDAFLEQGEIVSTRGRIEKNDSRTFATQGDILKGKPIVILINGGSASASEIVSGALQEHKRAIVIGTQSFGKGSVQTIMNLGVGKGAIKLTTSRYYTPSGKSIQGKGITPDIKVVPSKVTPLRAPQYVKESELKGALKNEKTGTKEKEMTRDERFQEQIKHDYQLRRALELLKAISIQKAE